MNRTYTSPHGVNMRYCKRLDSSIHKMINTSCKLGKVSDFQFVQEKKKKMSKIGETENVRSLRFGLNVSYHRDQAKVDGDFYAGYATQRWQTSDASPQESDQAGQIRET